VLGVVALMKIAAAPVPVIVQTRPVAGRRLWRRLAWAGAVGLVAYALVNVVVAWVVFGGLVTTTGGYDQSAELGHGALWDPLCLLWGLLMEGGLRLTRSRDTPGTIVTASRR
jgi:Protein of unknown function (DUF3995)